MLVMCLRVIHDSDTGVPICSFAHRPTVPGPICSSWITSGWAARSSSASCFVSAAGQQLIEAAETKQDALLDLAAHPLVIHDEQIGPGTVGLCANEQIGTPVSLSWITRRHITSIVFNYLRIRRDTRICLLYT